MDENELFLRQVIHNCNVDAVNTVNKNIQSDKVSKVYIERDIFKKPLQTPKPPVLKQPIPQIQPQIQPQLQTPTTNVDPSLIKDLITAFNKMSRQMESLQKKQLQSRVLKKIEQKISEESGEITIKIKFDKNESSN